MNIEILIKTTVQTKNILDYTKFIKTLLPVTHFYQIILLR